MPIKGYDYYWTVKVRLYRTLHSKALVGDEESMDSQESIFTNPLLLRLAIGYIRASRQQFDKETLKGRLMDAGLDADTVALLLDDRANDSRITLSKQPDPQPSYALGEQAPSLSLYIALVVIAGILILIAFSVQHPDWAGLSVNLATEIIGAVVILIIVDRRLRSSELQAIREYAESSSVRFASLFSPETRNTLLYAKALDIELQRIRPKPYFERPGPDFESLLEKQPKGFLLCGDPGSGKSTLLQSIAIRQNENVIRRPQSERIPILFPMRLWTDGTLSDQIWKVARQYSKIKRERFYRWLESGRLVVILDGLDETPQPEVMLAKVKEFRARYPSISLVASCRSYFLSRATSFLDLQTVEVSNLTKDEAAAFLRLLTKV